MTVRPDIAMTQRHLVEAWANYDAAVPGQYDPTFLHDMVHVGQVPPGIARRAAECLWKAEPMPFRVEDATPGFITCDFDANIVAALNTESTHLAFDARATWALADVLDALRLEVTQCFGSPWRTLGVRAYRTRPAAHEFGPYAWHTDGFPDQIFKIMIYLTALSARTGSIEFKGHGTLVSSELGIWALFFNSRLDHRGIPGTEAERLAVEITLCRAAEFDTRPRFPGVNSHWPSLPSIEALDGCDGVTARAIERMQSKAPSENRPQFTLRDVVARTYEWWKNSRLRTSLVGRAVRWAARNTLELLHLK